MVKKVQGCVLAVPTTKDTKEIFLDFKHVRLSLSLKKCSSSYDRAQELKLRADATKELI